MTGLFFGLVEIYTKLVQKLWSKRERITSNKLSLVNLKRILV